MQRLLRGLVPLLLWIGLACSGSSAAPTATTGAASNPPSAPTNAASSPTVAATQAATTYPLTLTDAANRQVMLKAEPKRLLSLVPSGTEIFYGLGLGDRVVAVTQFDNYPPEVKDKPKLQGGLRPSPELIASYTPDLVFTTSGQTAQQLAQQLEAAGITVYISDPKNFDQVMTAIETLGQMTNASGAARKLTAEMKTKLADVTSKVKNATSKPKVLVEIDGTDPTKPFVAGPGTYIDEMIQLGGGTNVVTGPQQYPQYSAEQIVAAAPELILLADEAFGTTVDSVVQRAGWENIPAVKNRAIRGVDTDLISRPSQRLVQGLESVARAIHPEVFK